MEPEGDVCGCRIDAKTGKRKYCDDHLHLRIKYIEPKRPKIYAAKPELLLKYGMSIVDPLARTMFFMLYMSGPRINEFTAITPQAIEDRGDRWVVRLPTLKQKDGGVRERRFVPIPKGALARCHENEMMAEVQNFLRLKESSAYVFRPWKNMSEYLARKLEIEVEAQVKTGPKLYEDRVITKRFNPHWLRHCRATHLVDYYDFSAVQLCRFFNWHNMNVALIYTRSADVWHGFERSGTQSQP